MEFESAASRYAVACRNLDTASAIHKSGTFAGDIGKFVTKLRRDAEFAFAKAYPVAYASGYASRNRGKKRVVSDIAIEIASDADIDAIIALSEVSDWEEAYPIISALGLVGEILAWPARRGIQLRGHDTGEIWGPHWGLENMKFAAALTARALASGPAVSTHLSNH